jgi:hypothetical protein
LAERLRMTFAHVHRCRTTYGDEVRLGSGGDLNGLNV